MLRRHFKLQDFNKTLNKIHPDLSSKDKIPDLFKKDLAGKLKIPESFKKAKFSVRYSNKPRADIWK